MGQNQSFLDRVYAAVNRPFEAWERAERATTPRTRWNLVVPGGSHVLALETKGDLAIRILVDGERAGSVAPPYGRSSRREATVDVAGTPVVVVLEWRPEWTGRLKVDVFVNGMSIADGATIEASRAAAPIPIGSYDEQMDLSEGGAFIAADSPMGCLFFLAWLIPVGVVNAWLLGHRELGNLRWLLLAMAAVVLFVAVLLTMAVVVTVARIVLG